MLRRFSLYGFLKNQKYYENFIILAFLEKGLSFTVIGFLIAFREIMINLFEVPSGAIADVWGRRRSMMLSFLSYIVSFVVFALADQLWMLFLAMFFFAIGDAFRTGTHKAMIFTWLRLQGREDERTKTYGYTRSWSKIGSMLSVILASVFVIVGRNYVYIFYFAIIPYVLGLINFMGYPSELDGERSGDVSLRTMASHLWSAFKLAVSRSGLRRLVLESMGFQGYYKAAKDYIQPVLAATAAVMLAPYLTGMDLNDAQQVALVMAPVFFVLHFMEAAASRNAHRVVDMYQTDDGTCSTQHCEDRGARLLWLLSLLVLGGMVPLMYFDIHGGIIAGFILLALLQNLWRPVQISRFDARSEEGKGATVLSIESQAKSGFTMIVAPALGWAVDYVQKQGIGGGFWPVAALGAGLAFLFLITSRISPRTAEA